MTTTICVTAIVVSTDGEASFSTHVGEDETLVQVIEEAKSEAFDKYEELVGTLNLAHRVLVHVDEVPEIKIRGTVIKSVVPEQSDGDPIKSQLIEA